MKESLGVRSENSALRAVRAKREADDAGKSCVGVRKLCEANFSTDREYRKGVHWLETLRLRRTKILASGYKVIFLTSLHHSLAADQ